MQEYHRMSYHNQYTLNGSFSARSVFKNKPNHSPCVVMRRNRNGDFDVGVAPQDFINRAVRPNRRYKPKLEKLKTFPSLEEAQAYLDELLISKQTKVLK